MSTDPHTNALELRRMLIDLHTRRDGGHSDAAADIAAAELVLYAFLRTHRPTLGRTDFWSGYYAEIDEFDRKANR